MTNRVSEYFKRLDLLPQHWERLADGEYVANLNGLVVTIRRNENGRFNWAILKESDDDFANEVEAQAALVDELSRFITNDCEELPGH